jgi:hypothetical protein
MKFKIASVLELIIPLSIALMLSAFLGCGGGGDGGSAYGNVAYDGTWTLTYKGYTKPDPAVSTDTVTCDETPATIEISHGTGQTTETITCQKAASATYYANVKVILAPAASGIAGTMQATVTGGGIDQEGICIDRTNCVSTSLKIDMFKN